MTDGQKVTNSDRLTDRRAGALAIGVFLLVIDIVVFRISYSDLQQYGGLLGQISQSLSAEVRNKVTQDQFMAVGGGIVAIIGLALTIYGLAANQKIKTKRVQKFSLFQNVSLLIIY